MAEGLYRIGECIYMEVFPPPMPYQICKIEELRKNTKGSVEVAAKCFYRRKDLPPSVLLCADRHSIVVEEENELEGVAVSSFSFDKLSEQERHLVRHRELFLSRQIETYKIDMVR
jgi:metastasis-associated protein MTA